MCAISGIWRFDACLDEEALRRFTRSMKHRGPDGEGYYVDARGDVGLGHRRLAILDLTERAGQPMSTSDSRYWITYNGEVYNFLELRRELERKGHVFRSDSDTEVVLAGYAQWGEDVQLRLNGMWAFALWDAESRTLFFSRDRFGIKPLYYAHVPGRLFAFASETAAFRHLEGFQREFDGERLAEAVRSPFSLEGQGETIFGGIRQVKPGHYLIVRGDCTVHERRWWCTRDHLVEPPRAYEDQVELFRETFESACLLRMRSDVPIVTALSGGLDSSSVYGMLRQAEAAHAPERLPEDRRKAVIGCYEGTSFDERRFAEAVVSKVGGESHLVPLGPQVSASRLVDQVLRSDYVYLSPPVAGDIYAAVARLAKVSLDGHGVDEMAYGYADLVYRAYVVAIRRADWRRSRELGRIFVSLCRPEDVPAARRRLRRGRRYNTPPLLKRVYRDYVPAVVKRGYRRVRAAKTNAVSTVAEPSAAEEALYEAFHVTILPTLLRNFDRAGMQSGVEIRMPFMDWRLVCLLFSLPEASKLGGGFTKRILRDAMRGVLPEAVRTRTWKVGLNAPLVEWFSGPLRPFLRDVSTSTAFVQSTVWDGKELGRFIEQRARQGWLWKDCIRVWPYLNAHILMKGGS